MTTPSVSIIVPLHDHATHVGAALDSLLAQRPPPNQVVVVDDGSTDGGGAIAMAYGPPVVVLRQRHSGSAAARNAGLAAVNGELVGFLDADDIAPTESVRVRVEALVAEPALDAVFGAVAEFADGDVAGIRPARAAMPGRVAGSMLAWRTAVTRVGPFQPQAGRGETVDWIARAVDAGFRYRTIADVVLWRRLHADNTGLRRRGSEADYVRVLKLALDRRRAGLPPTPAGPRS